MKGTKIAAGALVSAIILSIFGLNVWANPIENIDSITFKQSYVISNDTLEDAKPEIDTFSYVIGNNVDTSFTTFTGLNPVKQGDLDKVTLSPDKIEFNETIEAGAKNKQFDYDLTITFGTFDSAGIYRYTLNRSDDKFVYFDVYVFEQSGKTIVSACNFYDSNFTDTHQEKVVGFKDAYAIKDGETIAYDINSIIRFEDEKGNLLVDDIILTYSYTEPGKKITNPVKAFSRANNKVNTVTGITIYNAVATTLDEGLDSYKVTLAAFTANHYALIKDEVADNLALETPKWFSEDPNETLIFHVVMQAPTIFKIQIAKVDYDNNTYYLKGAEFTVYDADGHVINDINGNPCIGITDDNGMLEFEIIADPNTSYYVMETKAPKGYNINDEKFPVTPKELGSEEGDNITFIPIMVADLIIVPPKTGDTFNIALYTIMALISISGITCGVIYLRRKKIKQQTNSNE